MRLAITCIALLVFSVVANAAPVTWTLNNVLLQDGGEITGSFDYNAVTDIMSNVNITSTAYSGSFTINDSNISRVYFCPEIVCNIDTVDLFADSELSEVARNVGLYLAGPLTNSGGAIEIVTVYDALYEEDWGWREVNLLYPTTATISGVPIPAAAWLFGSALAGLGWMRRKPTS
jgi:hypothetical protein